MSMKTFPKYYGFKAYLYEYLNATLIPISIHDVLISYVKSRLRIFSHKDAVLLSKS